MKEPFTLQKEEISYTATRVGGGTGHRPPVLNWDEKHPFLFFSFFLTKASLSSNM